VKESATESIPPDTLDAGCRVRVKWCGKGTPVPRVTWEAWQTPPGARPHRGMLENGPFEFLGRSQKVPGNRHLQMNDRYLFLGNQNKGQNSAYELLRPIFIE